MKYLVILGDGMADRPIDSLGSQTPLAYAKTPICAPECGCTFA